MLSPKELATYHKDPDTTCQKKLCLLLSAGHKTSISLAVSFQKRLKATIKTTPGLGSPHVSCAALLRVSKTVS